MTAPSVVVDLGEDGIGAMREAAELLMAAGMAEADEAEKLRRELVRTLNTLIPTLKNSLRQLERAKLLFEAAESAEGIREASDGK